jgi:cbb3-type cytochrome c oxidase subunit III
MKLDVSAVSGLAMALAFGASIGHAAEDQEIKQLTTQVCAACHGPRGISTSPAFPNLAGQKAVYIEAQLKGFRDHTRGDPGAMAFMWGMSSQLGDDTIKRLAAHYAALSPARGAPADKTLVAKGKQIFDEGIAEGGIPACAACHGPNADGNENIPRLAGQHAPYLVKQLAYFKSLQRGNAPVMHAVGQNMTLEQMEAVAAYVASK